jgi:hypothetical protein
MPRTTRLCSCASLAQALRDLTLAWAGYWLDIFHDLNQTPAEPEFPAVTPTHSKCLGDHFSTSELCFDAAVNVTKMANVRKRADYFSYMCDKFPPDASSPLLFSAQVVPSDDHVGPHDRACTDAH